MLDKIEPIFSSGLKTSTPSLSSSIPGDGDFFSILRGKLEGSQPLEKMVIEYLIRTLDTALLAEESEKDEVFFSPSLFLEPWVPPETPSLPWPNPMQNSPPVSENPPKSQKFEQFIYEAGEKYEVDQLFIKAVIQAESGGDPEAISSAGAQGLMQLMPGTANELGVINPFDPEENIMAGTRYLRQLLDRYRGNKKLALAAYNWGMGNLEKRPESIPEETKRYINKVEKYYESLKA